MLLTCFRFVTGDLRSHHGDVQWTVGEWIATPGLHASRSARDSLRHVHGTCWFVAEARGPVDEGDDEFAATEMRLVREIPAEVLRRFAVLCATDCLPYLGDPEIRAWAEASLRAVTGGAVTGGAVTGGAVTGGAATGGAATGGAATGGAATGGAGIAIPGIPPGAAASRTVAAVAAAVRAASGAPAWAAAAASAAHAAHAGAAAARAVDELAAATAAITNVASGAAASRLADRAATLSRAAAAAGAAAHAASAEAATGRFPIDSASDPHYSGWRAWAVPIRDEFYEAQESALRSLL